MVASNKWQSAKANQMRRKCQRMNERMCSDFDIDALWWLLSSLTIDMCWHRKFSKWSISTSWIINGPKCQSVRRNGNMLSAPLLTLESLSIVIVCVCVDFSQRLISVMHTCMSATCTCCCCCSYYLPHIISIWTSATLSGHSPLFHLIANSKLKFNQKQCHKWIT